MDIKTIITEVKTWLTSTYTAMTSSVVQRKWCTLGMAKSTSAKNINDYFDRTAMNTLYKEQYKNDNFRTKEAYAYTQVEVQLVAATHRSFANRHKTRIQIYRDDCAQKHYHVKSAITMGYVKHVIAKERSEERR